MLLFVFHPLARKRNSPCLFDVVKDKTSSPWGWHPRTWRGSDHPRAASWRPPPCRWEGSRCRPGPPSGWRRLFSWGSPPPGAGPWWCRGTGRIRQCCDPPCNRLFFNPFLFIKNKRLFISSEDFSVLEKNIVLCYQRAMLPIQSSTVWQGWQPSADSISRLAPFFEFDLGHN